MRVVSRFTKENIVDQNAWIEIQLTGRTGVGDNTMDLLSGSRKLPESPTSERDRVIDVGSRRTDSERGVDADE